MFQLAWRGVRHNPARYVATLVAIITGVAFFSATGFLSDRVIDALQGDVDRQYGNVDAAVIPDDKGTAADFADKLRISARRPTRSRARTASRQRAGCSPGRSHSAPPEGQVFADGATGRLWIDDADLNPIDVEEGKAPVAAGEIAVDKGSRRRTTSLWARRQRSSRWRDRSRSRSSASRSSAARTRSTAAARCRSRRRTRSTGSRGARSSTRICTFVAVATRQSSRPRSSPPARRLQGAGRRSFLDDKRSEIGAPAEYLKKALQAFALLAMLVGGFVIYNTFSVIVSQRLRELAVMSAIGATPKQIKRVASVRGHRDRRARVAARARSRVRSHVPARGRADGARGRLPRERSQDRRYQRGERRPIGTLITVASVMIPARRAAKTEPIEALRAAAVERSPFSRTG